MSIAAAHPRRVGVRAAARSGRFLCREPRGCSTNRASRSCCRAPTRLSCYTGITRPTKDLDVFCKPSATRPRSSASSRGAATGSRSRTSAGSARSGRASISSTSSTTSRPPSSRSPTTGSARPMRSRSTAPRSGSPRRPSSSSPSSSSRTATATTAPTSPTSSSGSMTRSTGAGCSTAMELYWEVLLIHVLNFRFIYPTEREAIPHWLLDELMERLAAQAQMPPAQMKICRGRLFSPARLCHRHRRMGLRRRRRQGHRGAA